MELHRAHIVHMPLQREHALLHFIVPDLDEMVITAGDEHWLGLMEVDATYGT